jgi:hypothetical protein
MSAAERQGLAVGKKTPTGAEETADVTDHCLILGLTRAFVGLPHTFSSRCAWASAIDSVHACRCIYAHTVWERFLLVL